MFSLTGIALTSSSQSTACMKTLEVGTGVGSRGRERAPPSSGGPACSDSWGVRLPPPRAVCEAGCVWLPGLEGIRPPPGDLAEIGLDMEPVILNKEQTTKISLYR